MRDILVAGSAPYLPEWWNAWGRFVKERGVEVHVMNNAVRCLGSEADFWHLSEDLFDIFPHLRFINHSAIKIGFDDASSRATRPMGFPHSYETEVETGTTILNTIQHIINYEELVGNSSYRLMFIGCDLRYDYGPNATHFYNGGVPDPLRLGPAFLKRVLSSFGRLVEESGNSVFNLSSDPETLLPFKYVSVEAINFDWKRAIPENPRAFIGWSTIERFVEVMATISSSRDEVGAKSLLDAFVVGFPEACSLGRLSQAFQKLLEDRPVEALSYMKQITPRAWDWLMRKVYDRDGQSCRALFTAAIDYLSSQKVTMKEYLICHNDVWIAYQRNYCAAFIHFSLTGLPVENREIVRSTRQIVTS